MTFKYRIAPNSIEEMEAMAAGAEEGFIISLRISEAILDPAFGFWLLTDNEAIKLQIAQGSRA